MPGATIRSAGPYDELVDPNVPHEQDLANHRPGELAQVVMWADNNLPSGTLGFRRSDGRTYSTGKHYGGGNESRFVTLPPADGTWTLTIGGTAVSGGWATIEVAGPEQDDEATRPDHMTPVDEVREEDDTLDPSNYRWIVNADNDEGIAPAPELRRQGVELGPNGATFSLPNGETVDVGAIEDADEVARIIDEDSNNSGDVGDVIDADQPAVDDGADESSGSNTPSSGDLGAGGAVLAVLALAYMAYR